MDRTEEKDELVRCLICTTYIKGAEGFTCPRCKKGPFCRKHRIPGRRECAGCVFEMKHREVLDLKKQEQGIKDFIKLLQFIFLVFAVFFVAIKAGLTEFVDFLRESIVTHNLIYFGIIPVAGYLLFYIILYNQRSRIKEIEGEMHAMERIRMSK